MSSTNKTSLGLNIWEASDKPVRQDFVNDNTIIDEKITNINSNLDNVNSNLNNISGSLNNVNSNLTVVTGTAVKWTADITINDCKKVGKLCFCNVYASKASGTITADESLFSVPWKPNNAAYFVVTGRNTTSGATEPIPVYIETEYSTIRATSAHSGSNEVRCYFAYITT